MQKKSNLERAMGVVTEVHAGEGVTALLLSFNVFVLLTAYYIIKPVREALILVSDSGAEYKSYSSGAVAVLLLVAVPAYSSVANRLPRNRLIVAVTLFFAANLVLFYVLGRDDSIRPWLAIPFYLWVGIFNMMVVAQFWAFANDLYNEEEGGRLFPLIGIGASVGAAVGSKVAAWLSGTVGLFQLLLASASLLLVCAALTELVHRRDADRGRKAKSGNKTAAGNGFSMVFQHHYLILLAAFSLLFTFVNSNGEYLLSAVVSQAAQAAEAAGTLGGLSRGQWIGRFYGDFFFWVNVVGVVLQAFFVSRLLKYGGLKFTFMILPLIVLVGASAIALLPLLLVLRVSKTLENGTDYSVNNTVRHLLWLPTTKEMKYKAKQAVDTFFVRMGDVASALLVFVGVTVLGLSVRGVALCNVVLAVGWLFLAGRILREQRTVLDKADLGGVEANDR